MHDTQPPQRRIPVFRRGYPSIILILSAAIILVSLYQFNAPPQMEDWLLRAGALISGPAFEGIERPFGNYVPFFAHIFLHGGGLHLGLNMLGLMAMGPIVALALGQTLRGWLLFLAFFLFCALGGGLAEMIWGLVSGKNIIAIGASSAISGLLPAIGYIQNRWQGAWSMSKGWIFINLCLAVAGEFIALPIAWAAHLGGTFAGFSVAVFLAFASRHHEI